MTATIHPLISYPIFPYLISSHIIFQDGKRRWLSGSDRSIPSSSTSSLGTLEQVEIAVECNQLSNVITYNAMFQIVRLLAITNVKTIIKPQKPQRTVPQIYVAYDTNTIIFMCHHIRLASEHFVKSTEKSWNWSDPLPPSFGNARISKAPGPASPP